MVEKTNTYSPQVLHNPRKGTIYEGSSLRIRSIISQRFSGGVPQNGDSEMIHNG